jgi:5-deoxy-glucuronate isomerase
MGDRMDVFEKTPPHCLYVPNGATGGRWRPRPARWPSARPPARAATSRARLGPEGITLTPRGKGRTPATSTTSRWRPLDVADSLLVTEVFTPAGNWSSYPSHRHDEDDFPRMTYLEETYYTG